MSSAEWHRRIRSSLPPRDKRLSLSDWLFEREMQSIRAERANGNGNEPLRYCDCPELVLNGERFPCPPQHNCDYVRERSALVSDAVRAIGEVTGDSWTAAFAREMEKRAAPLLRQSGNGADLS